MRIALVHDYLKEYGGAEKVLEELSEIFPDAPIYTTLYRPQFFGPHRPRLSKKWHSRIHQSFFNYIPFAHKIISPLRLISSLAFKSFDFSKFDLICEFFHYLFFLSEHISNQSGIQKKNVFLKITKSFGEYLLILSLNYSILAM